MRYEKGKRRARMCRGNAEMTCRKWVSMLLCVIFVCGLLAGCGDDKAQNVKKEQSGSTAPADVPPEGLAVHTEYGDLYYPERWQEYVTTVSYTHLTLPTIA